MLYPPSDSRQWILSYNDEKGGTGSCRWPLIHPKHLFRAPSMESSLEIVLEWLMRCKHDHPLRDASSTSLPSRVINVSSRAEPFLQETNGEQGDYAALSYCWGLVRNTEMMTTSPKSKGRHGAPDLKPNIERHKEKIPFVAMPKTFQDSIIVCRCLGIRYLWIDVFCIVQGDEVWEREHVRMGDIYSNAKLVIAASNAEAPEKGFLRSLEGLSSPIIGSDLSSEERNISNLETQVSGRSPGLRSTTDVTSPLLLDEPLNRRAWALPEAIFSNRILHFTSTGMIWECNHARNLESGQTQILHALSPCMDYDDSFRVFRSHHVARTYTMNAMYKKCHSVIEHFTARQINKSPEMTYNDGLRLLPLACLARRFSQIMHEVFSHQDVYLAGILER
ncbi:heterokaryon incompatibility protein-domain-containing protein [Xylariaceae sp. FL0255]|nr:heterokaryon incompatibility protein-domain-containing protein [Xylariaceae sp. FL0255]